jgi:hypothetical protein
MGDVGATRQIPEDEDNDLFADWEADAEVSDLLIA